MKQIPKGLSPRRKDAKLNEFNYLRELCAFARKNFKREIQTL
jgi:hypothetical protein